MIGLSHYQTCAQAAIQAAGRTRGAAAANSRRPHPWRLLSAFDALAPWPVEVREPEPDDIDDEPEPAPVRPQPIAREGHKGNWQSRTDEQRIAAILAELRPGEWLSTCILRDRVHLGSDRAPEILDALVARGLVLRKQDRTRTYYSKAA